MTVSYNLRAANGASMLLNLPDPSRIPIPAVRDAVAKFAKRAAQTHEAASALAQARDAVKRATSDNTSEANDAAADGGSVPAKKLVKRLRAAEDTLEEAKLEYAGREHALMKAYGNVVETIQHHAPAWRASAQEAAEASILRVTTARELLRKAGVELDEALGTLGMLDRMTTGHPVTGVIDQLPALAAIDKSGMYVSIAFENMAAAIGEAMQTLDVQRGAERSTPDVVVPMSGEDTVDEPTPTSDELAITAEPDDE